MEKQNKSRYFHSKDFQNLVNDIIRNNGPYSGTFTLEDILYYRWYWWQKDTITDYFLIPVLIDEMFKFIGHPEINFDYIVKHPYINYMDWYCNWSWTEDQYKEFESKVLVPTFKKLRPHMTKHYIDNNCAWFSLSYGLTYLTQEEIEKRREENKQKAINLCNEYGRTLDEWQDIQVKFLTKKIKDYPERVFLKDKYNIPEKVYDKLNTQFKYDIKEIKNALKDNPNLVNEIKGELERKEKELQEKIKQLKENPELWDKFISES